MEVAAAKLPTKIHALGEAEIPHNREMLTKWLKQVGGVLPIINSHIKEVQEKANEKFVHTGLPGRKTEDYKYTPVRNYFNEEFNLSVDAATLSGKDIEQFLLSEFISIVMVNGVFVPELSDTNKLPEEISIKSLHTAITEGNNIALQYFNSTLEHSKNPFALLNTAICKDGIFIHIPEKITCLTPIHLIHINCGRDKQFTNTRNLICISKNAEVTIIESYHSMNSTTKIFSNNVTEFIVEDSAKLENYILQDEGMDNYRNDVRQFSVGTNGFMNTVCVSINGGLVRNDANVLINGEHSETHLNGLFLVKENHHTDNHTMVEHRVPNCFSNELYKGIVADGSTGVFNGKILVYHDAQKTNAYQSNKNILLGDKATINTKPQLEIYADDVRCTHGTSTGKLNEEALFYLESRGLHKNLARKVLLQAFAKEVSNTIKDDAFRTFIEQKIEENIQ